MRLVVHRLPLRGRMQGLLRGLSVTTGAPLRRPKEEHQGIHRCESREVPQVVRSHGVARGILWGVDTG